MIFSTSVFNKIIHAYSHNYGDFQIILKSSTTMIIVLSKILHEYSNIHYDDKCPVKHDAQKAIYRTVSEVEKILKVGVWIQSHHL